MQRFSNRRRVGKSFRNFLIALLFFHAVILISGTNLTPAGSSQTIVAEGAYDYGSSSSETTHENWTLSRTAAGFLIVEGTLMHSGSKGEMLNYRIEMDQRLRAMRIESHTSMDYPSYTCKLGSTSVQCVISFADQNPPSSGRQDARMKRPFDLLGLHSYGWNIASILGRLAPGQSRTTVHLFLPNEDRYPNAVVEVQRESPEPITIAGKTFEAQKYLLHLVMDAREASTATVWTSKSGLCLRMQGPTDRSSADLPIFELVRIKQAGPNPLVPELQ